MKIPNLKSALIDPQKIRDYCLNPDHPRGKHKARVFAAKLGIYRDDWDTLLRKIIDGLDEGVCLKAKSDQYGQRFMVDMEIENGGRVAQIRTTWIILSDEKFPRLTSCYVQS